MLYVDTVFDRAMAAGAKVKQPVQNKFYGDRNGVLADRSATFGPSPLTRRI